MMHAKDRSHGSLSRAEIVNALPRLSEQTQAVLTDALNQLNDFAVGTWVWQNVPTGAPIYILLSDDEMDTIIPRSRWGCGRDGEVSFSVY